MISDVTWCVQGVFVDSATHIEKGVLFHHNDKDVAIDHKTALSADPRYSHLSVRPCRSSPSTT